MIKLKMEEQNGHDILAVMDGKECVLSLPASLNMGTMPSVSEAVSILAGESLNMGPCGSVTVFRIEHKKNGMGMYNCEPYKNISDCPLYDHARDKKFHPAPWQDSKLARQMYALHMIDPSPLALMFNGTPLTEESEEWRYGFASKEQARMWLHDDRIINFLADNDFIVAELVISFSDALIGNTQVMFRNTPSKYKKHGIKTFFGI